MRRVIFTEDHSAGAPFGIIDEATGITFPNFDDMERRRAYVALQSILEPPGWQIVTKDEAP